jgi:SAM-dependent methyltransferase
MEAMSDWRSFWDSAHSIYVNARHKEVHYREIADQIAAFVPGREARVLDYGCGEAIHADRVAAVAGEVLLCDAAPSVRAAIAARFAGKARLRVLAPDDVEKLADGSLDLVVSNSVTQYLTPAEFDRLLALWHRLLAPHGMLVIGDVIPPEAGALTDVTALLRYAARNGFFAAAVWGLARTMASPYRKLRSRIGVTRYPQAAFMAKLKSAGFSAERLPRNLEHNAARMTFRAIRHQGSGIRSQEDAP